MTRKPVANKVFATGGKVSEAPVVPVTPAAVPLVGVAETDGVTSGVPLGSDPVWTLAIPSGSGVPRKGNKGVKTVVGCPRSAG
jgi:hypothetical protein